MATLLFLAVSIPNAACADEDGEPDRLHEVMETMGRTLRKLKRQIQDSNQLDSSKKMLEKMENCAKEALELEPSTEIRMTREDHEKWIANYKKMIGGLIRAIEETQTALDKSEFDVAGSKLSEILERRRKGHEAFDVEED